MPHVMSKAYQDFCTSFWDSLLNNTSWAQCLQSSSEIILNCRSSGKEKSMATWPATKRNSESCLKQAQRHASSSLHSQADAHATELNGAGWKFEESNRMSSWHLLIWCVLHLISDALHSDLFLRGKAESESRWSFRKSRTSFDAVPTLFHSKPTLTDTSLGTRDLLEPK